MATASFAPTQQLALVDPQQQLEEARYQRQQDMAKLLMQQGMQGQGQPTQVINGWAVKQSPLSAIAPVMQTLMGQWMANKADEDRAGRVEKGQQEFKNWIGAQPRATPDQTISDFGTDPGTGTGVDIRVPGSKPTDQDRLAWALNGMSINNPMAQQIGMQEYQNARLVSALRDYQGGGGAGGMGGSAGAPGASGGADLAGVVPLLNMPGAGGKIGEFLLDSQKPTDFSKDLRLLPQGQQGAAVSQHFFPPVQTRGDAILTRDAQGNLTIDPASVQAMVLKNQMDARFKPALAGATAGAEASARLPFTAEKIDLLGGPQLMTGQQRQDLLTGGAQGGAAQVMDPLVAGVIRAESGGNQAAVSPKGARGAMQLMPGTAAGLGVNSRDRLENVAGGVNYLSQLRQKYGDDKVALAAYNWGPGKVDRWLQQGGDFSKLPAETRNYISTVMGYAGGASRAIAAQPQQSGGMPGVRLQDEATQRAGTEAAKQGMDAIFSQYGTLRNAKSQMAIFDRAAEIVPKSFSGKFADSKLEAAKAINSVFGTNVSAEKVQNTEELRSLLFQAVMDNLKKLDASPSQEQQRILQQSLGNITTDPSAIPRIVDIAKQRLRESVSAHNQVVAQAKQRGINFPFDPTINLSGPIKKAAPAAPSPAGGVKFLGFE